MATHEYKTMFGNNERREANVVVGALPAVLAPADLREGEAETVIVTTDTYEVIKLPAGVVVTNAFVVVDDAYDGAVTFAAAVGAVTVVAAANGAVEGITLHATGWIETLITDETVCTLVPTITGASTKGVVKLVVEYYDYNRSTKSFIS